MTLFSNLGMSEWLILCAAIMFVVVLIDGVRRMRVESRQDLKWDLQMAREFPEEEEDEQASYDESIESEYRIVDRSQEIESEELDVNASQDLFAERVEPSFDTAIQDNEYEQPIADSNQPNTQQPEALNQQPAFDARLEETASFNKPMQDHQALDKQPMDDLIDGSASKQAIYDDAFRNDPQAMSAEPVWQPPVMSDLDKQEQQAQQDSSAGHALTNDDDIEIISLHVKSQQANGFAGTDLLQILLSCDMRYGENQILHRYKQTTKPNKKAEQTNDVIFSVANMFMPGTFDLENLATFKTTGVTFFMVLPGVDDPQQTFNTMLAVAQAVAKHLNGVILDEDHSSVTPQVLNHYQEKIRHIMVKNQLSSSKKRVELAPS